MMEVHWKAARGPLIQGVPGPDSTVILPSNRWTENPDAVLFDEMWWPTSNTWVPSTKQNRLYPRRVDEWVQSPSWPAVIGQSGDDAPEDDQFKMKLTDEPVNPDFSLLFVDDGAHRSIAAVLDGERWVRATMQAAPMVRFGGGLTVEN
jgi:hypothetical protein